MSFGWLFLGELHSCSARLRFTNRYSFCNTGPPSANMFSVNGKQRLSFLCHAMGQPHAVYESAN